MSHGYHIRKISQSIIIAGCSLLLTIILSANIFADEPDDEQILNKQLSGKLILSSGSGISIIDLKNFSQNFIYKIADDYGEISDIFPVDNKHFLFSEDSYHPSQQTFIKEYNLETEAVRTITPGKLVSYLPETNKLFLKKLANSDDEKIYMTNYRLGQRKSPSQLTRFTPCQAPLVKIGKYQIICRKYNDPTKFLLYNFLTLKSQVLPISDCQPPFFWRIISKQVVCNNEGKILLTNLEGTNKKYIPLLGSAFIMYLQKYDLLVFLRPGSYHFLGDSWILYFYDFSSGSIFKLPLEGFSHQGGMYYEQGLTH